MRIRSIKSSDFSPIKKLLRTHKSAHWTTASFNRMVRNPYNAHFVAEEAGKLVGVIFGLSDGCDVGYLYKLEVDPAFRRKGIGKALVQHALKEWKPLKLRLIFGRVAKKNKPSKALFEKS